MENRVKKQYMKVLRFRENAPVEKVGVAFLNPSGTWNLVIKQPVAVGERLKLCPPKPRPTSKTAIPAVS